MSKAVSAGFEDLAPSRRYVVAERDGL